VGAKENAISLRYASAEQRQLASAFGVDDGLTKANPMAMATAILMSINIITLVFYPACTRRAPRPECRALVNPRAICPYRGTLL
jgi:hypothetical protein